MLRCACGGRPGNEASSYVCVCLSVGVHLSVCRCASVCLSVCICLSVVWVCGGAYTHTNVYVLVGYVLSARPLWSLLSKQFIHDARSIWSCCCSFYHKRISEISYQLHHPVNTHAYANFHIWNDLISCAYGRRVAWGDPEIRSWWCLELVSRALIRATAA